MRKLTPYHLQRWLWVSPIALCASLGWLSPAQADILSELQARYQQDLRECEMTQATQDLTACRLEARNALAEAKRNLLDDAPGTSYEKNQFKRCHAFKGDDRAACIARLRGEGSSTGDVSSGGILREVVRPVPSR